MESWIASLNTKVQEFTQDSTPVIPEVIALAQVKTKKAKKSKKHAKYSYLGVATVSAGAIATVAYLYKKSQQKATENVQSFNIDEEFVLV